MDKIRIKLDSVKKPDTKQTYNDIIAAIDHNIDTWKMTTKTFLAVIKRKQKEVEHKEKANRKIKKISGNGRIER